MKMVSIIMWISPIGISSVIAAKILSVANLATTLSQLGLFILTVCGGIFLYQFTFLQAIYFVFVRKNPFRFWCQLFQAWMTSFATASTATALPITLQCLELFLILSQQKKNLFTGMGPTHWVLFSSVSHLELCLDHLEKRRLESSSSSLLSTRSS